MAIYMSRETRIRFSEHAAPEAINAQVAKTMKELQKLTKHLLFLTELQGARVRQVRAGEWPAKVTK